MSRWLCSFVGIDPRNPTAKWTVGIAERLYRHLQNNGHEKAIARLLLVRHVLEGETTQICKGWCRPEKEDCYVYVGYPDVDYKSLTISTPAPPQMAFLVFVLLDGTIAEWTWRPLIEGDKDRPEGLVGDTIWPLSTT